MEATKTLESPRQYFYWSALTTVSATVAKRVYLDRGGVYKLYPNIYTFLISKKSGLRKGVPVNLAKQLANEVGTVRVIDGQNSIQGVIKELSQVRTLEISKHIINKAEGFLVTGEFASFLIGDGLGFSLTTLTDLYDTQYHEHGFRKRLAGSDEIHLKGLCLTALFASNETHFFDSVPQNAITGGFLARTFCVYAEKKSNVVSLMRKANVTINRKEIVQHLQELSKLKGEFTVEEKAIVLYEEWYNDFAKKEFEDETGTEERIGDNILKLAMLLSLADSPNLIIDFDQMDEAITKSMDCFVGLRRLLMGGRDSKTVKGATAKIAMGMMLRNAPTYETSRREILVKGIGVFGPYDLDETIEHFIQARIIKSRKESGDTFYKLQDHIVQKHLELENEK